MSSPLGAILDKLQDNFNTIKFTNMAPNIERSLQKNNFLSFFNFPALHDNYNTTIPYLKLQPTEGRFFNHYVFRELLRRDELPKMSEGANKKILESIYEIFVNAQIHSESEYIYTSGQFYPNKNKIEFTITDVGIGFKNKVNKRFGSTLNATQAIEWAMQDKNTTKVGISGGIGLTFLKEFTTLNRGKMQIVSNDGFYQYENQDDDGEKEILKLLSNEFPGTVVNLQFSTNDSNSYILKTEVDANDIF